MSLTRYFLRLTARQFSISRCQWFSNQVDIYKGRSEWYEKFEAQKNARKLRLEKRRNEYGPPGHYKIPRKLHRFGLIFRFKGELWKLIEKRVKENEIFNQTFMERRVDILGPDLAAAHFIVSNGGAVKFLGVPQWVGLKKPLKLLPTNYIPGYYIEAIDASGTDLYYEGVITALHNLERLKWLSLKGLEKLNNFSLDLICSKCGDYLEHLDLTGCKGIDYNGLSCIYKFKHLKVLNLSLIGNTPEMKVACILLKEILPNLQIIGVDVTNLDFEDESCDDNLLKLQQS